MIAILLAAAALASAAATLMKQLRLEQGLFLTSLLTVLAVLAPLAQGWLKQAQALLDKQDQKEEERAKAVADRARGDVLEQIRQAWVRPELHGSLYAQARIELGLAERPAAVDNPVRAVLRRPDEPDRPLKPGQPIAQVYRQLGRQLLILGEPGAGKTTLLMELTDQLIDATAQTPDQQMPVVFHLSRYTLLVSSSPGLVAASRPRACSCVISFALLGQDTPKPDARRQAMGDRSISQPGQQFVSPHSTPSSDRF